MNMLESDALNTIKYQLPEIAKQLTIANKLKALELASSMTANLNDDYRAFLNRILSINI